MASFESPDTHEEEFIEDFILSFMQGFDNLETTWLNWHREKLEPWLLNRTANLDELKESFSSALGQTEKQFLQIIALVHLHHELIDDRDPLPAETDSSTLTPEVNDRRSSIALRRELDQNRLKAMFMYWSALDRLMRLITCGWEYGTILPNYEVRFDYFKTCLTHFRTNLRVLLKYNLVERMPTARILNDPAVFMVTDIKYRIRRNWLLESLYTPVQTLLENHDQPPSVEVCWPGDEKPVIEPKSSFKNIFTAEIIMTNRFVREFFSVRDEIIERKNIKN